MTKEVRSRSRSKNETEPKNKGQETEAPDRDQLLLKLNEQLSGLSDEDVQRVSQIVDTLVRGRAEGFFRLIHVVSLNRILKELFNPWVDANEPEQNS